MTCKITKDFLTLRRHKRQTPEIIYALGQRIRLVYGKTSLNDLVDSNLLVIKLSASIPTAFGTINLYPTTCWCIEMLEKYLQDGKVLDVGTGAGILAIAAFKLKPKNQVFAFDIYQDAIKQAKINFRLNGLEKHIKLKQAKLNDYPINSYSTIIANLPPIAISELLSNLIDRLAIDGNIIISGILKHNFTDIERKLISRNLKIIDKVITNLWCLVVAEKCF